MTDPTRTLNLKAAVPEAMRLADQCKLLANEASSVFWRNGDGQFFDNALKARNDSIDALASLVQPPETEGSDAMRVYGSQYTPQQRAWCLKYERETTFEPLMCDFEAGNETFLAAAKNSRAWFESWAGDAYLRGCDDIPGECEALYEEITGEKYEGA